jgi:hypothetical protein
MRTYILIAIFVIMIIWAVMRQHRIKQIIMMGGAGHGSGGHGSGGHGSGGHGSSGMGRGGPSGMGRGGPSGMGRGDPSGHHDIGHGRGHGRGYPYQRGHMRYVNGAYYDGGWGNGWGWWPYWLDWNWWYPRYDCMDYATDQCQGVDDYQSCFNAEYQNCPYNYYY